MSVLTPLHAGISVRNMDRSIEWYTRVLGFQMLSREKNAALDAELCFLVRDGFQLELFQYSSPKPLPDERFLPDTDLKTLGTKHIAYQVENLSVWLEHFETEHVDIVFSRIMKGKPMCFIRDPDGILLELIEIKQ